MIDLPTVTVFNLFYNSNRVFLDQACRVFNFMQSFMRVEEFVLFSYLEPSIPCKARVIQVPCMELEAIQIFLVKVIPHILRGRHLMSIHYDGFPYDETQWSDEFLNYDFIGAPWGDGVVGNGAFCMHTDAYRMACVRLPHLFNTNSDEFPNRIHRKKMEEMGVEFAPVEIASKFSSEMTAQEDPSFGFHGEHHNAPKFKKAWDVLENWEKEQRL